MVDVTAVETQRAVAVPEQGNLVRVRDRYWVVESVRRSSRPVDPMSSNGWTRHHLVALVPIDDKGSPSPLSVFWETEPGTEIRPQSALPDPAEGLDAPEVFAGFLDAVRWGAIEREVEVTLILETPDNPGGPLIIDANHPFEPIKTTASFYRWPSEARQAFFAASARLHAKCVIADRSAALITSANLTSAGINDNLELGVLVEAGTVPARLAKHLDLLIEQGVLERVEAPEPPRERRGGEQPIRAVSPSTGNTHGPSST